MSTLYSIFIGLVVVVVMGIFVIYSPDQCGTYKSPVRYTAQYEYRVGGFWGTSYYTDNYTLNNETVTFTGYYSKYHDINSDGTMTIEMNKIDYIRANPDLGKETK
jgi:hypothetical protein